MRYGLAAICVAAAAGVLLVALAGDDSVAASAVWPVAAIMFLVAGVGGLIAVAVSLLRAR